jgi:hypothetical protein
MWLPPVTLYQPIDACHFSWQRARFYSRIDILFGSKKAFPFRSRFFQLCECTSKLPPLRCLCSDKDCPWAMPRKSFRCYFFSVEFPPRAMPRKSHLSVISSASNIVFETRLIWSMCALVVSETNATTRCLLWSPGLLFHLLRMELLGCESHWSMWRYARTLRSVWACPAQEWVRRFVIHRSRYSSPMHEKCLLRRIDSCF